MRELPELAHYRPRLTDPSRPDASAVMVATPAGDELEAADPALAARLGSGVRVIRQKRGVFDERPLSLISDRSLAGLGALADTPQVPERFRPSLLVVAGSAGRSRASGTTAPGCTGHGPARPRRRRQIPVELLATTSHAAAC